MVYALVSWGGLLDGVDFATCRVLLVGQSAACRESDVMHDVILGMIVARQVDRPASWLCLPFIYAIGL
jgi:hypothetical protein